MQIIIFSIFILVVIDILIVLKRLRVSGLIASYKLLFHDIGYHRRTSPSIIRNSHEKTILMVGDCTAVGPMIAVEDTLAGKLADTFRVNVINRAINGAKTKDIVNQIDSAASKKFFLTILHTGNNDISQLTNLDKLRKDIIVALDKAKSVSEHVILFRGGNVGSFPIFPVFIGWIYAARSRKVRTLFQKIAKDKSVTYIEKFMERKEDIFLKDYRDYYCWDLLHLNSRGYKVWFDCLVEEMGKANIRLDNI